MSRVLRLRAYDSATGKVSEPFDVKESWGDYLIDFGDYSADGALDSIIWEQFTGLLDRNGKEIYEGDIVNVYTPKGEKYTGVVKYAISWYYVSVNGQYGVGLQDTVGGDTEVIGNIHEPPKDFRPEHLKRMGVSVSKGGGE